MKKIFLITLLLFFSSHVNAQTKALAKRIYVKQWDKNAGVYKQTKQVDCSIMVFIYNDHIFIDDKSKSTYSIVRTLPSSNRNGVRIVTYDAIDMKQNDCTVSLCSDGSEVMLVVEYEHSLQKCYWIIEQ